MPPKPVQPRYARQNTDFQAAIAKHLVLRGWGKPELAEVMNWSRSQLYTRLKTPGKLTLDQLRHMCRMLQFSDEEIMQLFK